MQKCSYRHSVEIDIVASFDSKFSFNTGGVPPSRCLGFISRWQKTWKNASHVADLHDQTNQTVYHMSRLVHSHRRSSVTKLKKILFYCVLEYYPVVAWVFSQDCKKFGKTHPTWSVSVTIRIKRCIICCVRFSPLGGVWSAS